MSLPRKLSAFARSSMPIGLLTAVVIGITAMPARADLIGLYQFNDPTNLGKDTSGNNNNATNNGATFTISGYQNGGAFFDGTTGFLRSPINVDVTALPQLTWGAWAQPLATNGNRAVLSSDNGDYDRDIDIDTRTGGQWSTFNGNGAVSSGVTPSTSAFTFLAAVYNQNANSLIFYVDGQSVSSATSFGSSHTFFDIGHNPDFGEFFNGTIDNVFVYNQALTANDIATIRANGFPTPAAVPEPGSVALLVGVALVGGHLLSRRRGK